jgi:hypothetical protein
LALLLSSSEYCNILYHHARYSLGWREVAQLEQYCNHKHFNVSANFMHSYGSDMSGPAAHIHSTQVLLNSPQVSIALPTYL